MNTTNYLGYNDWRLPTTLQPEPSCSDHFVWGGNTYGYGSGCTGSEMGHLFYNELGNIAYPNSGWGLSNKGPFSNLDKFNVYWSATDYPVSYMNSTWQFSLLGSQSFLYKDYGYAYAWAVRSGDVSSSSSTHVPEPGTLMLLASGLAGMVVWRKKNSKQK